MPILKVGELDLISHSAEQTLRLGARLGALLAPGHLICLSGEMGAGKTVFCNGLGQGWGAFEPLVSPTYTIVHQHHRDSDQALLYHLDCYRLNSADDADSIEFDDLLDSGAVLLIEWPEKIASRLPVECLWVRLRTVDATHRSLSFLPTGARYITLIEQFRQKVIGD
ncbi:MAG: tRNA (adenosine(37)-N6)-threonylcarbamoyltransferase complex ATPase subunit type 1 TsaE [Chloroflexi bacterium]|nr:tRNA (adenosine(37)-N6)-threonylcarbamoyltransferase complex ATPase subunit type 1 TsaE [Chloroflexota bacterium]